MKKIIAIAVLVLGVTGCSTTYYTYYEVDSIDEVNIVSKTDGVWSRTGVTPTRCVGAYPDSTGHQVYLMETKVKEE